ncbi:hypothetical protein IFM89_027084, partial [Coptis chinensis]
MNIRIKRIKLDEDGGQYCKDSSVVKKALEEAFINADTGLLNWLEETGKQTESGSTATAIFLRNDMLIVSHVLSRSGKAEVLTNPHRPYGNNKDQRSQDNVSIIIADLGFVNLAACNCNTGHGKMRFAEVLDLFDVKRNGVIESREFIRSLGIFHPNTPLEEKVAFAFRLYDLTQTGLIEREELKEMVLALLIESDLALTEDVVKTIVDKTFTDADSKGDGRTNMHQMAARLLSSQTIKGGDSGGLEDIKVDSVGLQQLGSVEQEAEKCIFPLRNLCCSNSATLENGRILILKVGNGYHVYDVQLQQLRSLEINPKN